MKLNLGAGDRRIEGFASVDISEPADVIADLNEKWVWAESSVEAVKAFDIFEHLIDKIHTMNELHRVLIADGVAEVEVPSASHGAGAFQDPTHRSFWTMNDFQYYQDGSFAVNRLAKSYGITARFKVEMIREQQHPDIFESVWKIYAILRAVK